MKLYLLRDVTFFFSFLTESFGECLADVNKWDGSVDVALAALRVNAISIASQISHAVSYDDDDDESCESCEEAETDFLRRLPRVIHCRSGKTPHCLILISKLRHLGSFTEKKRREKLLSLSLTQNSLEGKPAIDELHQHLFLYFPCRTLQPSLSNLYIGPMPKPKVLSGDFIRFL